MSTRSTPSTKPKPKRSRDASPRASRGTLGRPLDDPHAGPRRDRTITITDAEWYALKRIGGGNASAAITCLLTWWTRRRKRP